jgi:hypothetical protein
MIKNRSESGAKSVTVAAGNGTKLAINGLKCSLSIPLRHNYVALNILGGQSGSVIVDYARNGQGMNKGY